MTLLLGVFVVASAAAQDATFLVGSTHKANLALNAGNACEWKIYKVTDFAETKDANPAAADEFTFKDGIDNTANVDITWEKPGMYYLIVEEFNGGLSGCSSKRAFAIEVVPNALQMEFVSILSSDCYDGNDITPIPIKLQVDATDALSEKYYDVTVSYTVKLGEDVVKTGDQTFAFGGPDENGVVDLSVLGIEEELDKTKVYTIIITEAKDRFNTPFTIVPSKGTHTRTINQLPQTGTMVQQ